MTRDAHGRLTGALYVVDGKTYGWRLELDHDTGTGVFISPDRMGEYRWRGGAVELYTAWNDGPTSRQEVAHEAWVDSCLADIRDTGYVHVARKATRALDEGDFPSAERLFRAFEIYARSRPGAYNAGALGRIFATASLVKAAQNAVGGEELVATALAAALAAQDSDEKGAGALGRRLRRVLGERHLPVVGRAVSASLAAVEADWNGLGDEGRWKQLLALRDRVDQVAGSDGLSALAEVAAAKSGEDQVMARFAQVLAARTGQRELLGEVSLQLAEHEGSSNAELNNLANSVMHEGDYDRAESILAAVEARLPVEVGSERQAMVDEYFLRANLAELFWRQERYRAALPAAERAYQLERQIADSHGAIFSAATWSIISIYTRLGRIDDAERVFEGELNDPARLAARLAADAAAIENAFNAGMCIYTESKTPEKMARGRRLFEVLVERIPVPSSAILTWCYAGAFGYYGEDDKAKEFLERAIAMGVSRPELRNDPDFDPVRDRPWFKELLG
jgi:hypothetical protein